MRFSLLLLLPAVGCLTAAVWSYSARPSAPSAAEQARERAATPEGYVYVPGGECLLGSNDPDADGGQRPEHRKFLPSFYIARHEVTQAEWKRFRPDHVVPAGKEGYPITNVGRDEAMAYCRWVAGYLPSDDEWEKAARGVDGRRYPWGNEFEPTRTNLGRPRKLPPEVCAVPGIRRGLVPVEAFPTGASPYGALQMAGNAWEWVSGNYDGDPQRWIIRGGAYGYGELAARTYHRAIEGAGVT
ncbi:MAG: formylglycine-generating enzyme family protein [Armatimonadetes bacterium]|nr:formylglycine-generating enzyme family protein [Armatimonadota bacterium]